MPLAVLEPSPPDNDPNMKPPNNAAGLASSACLGVLKLNPLPAARGNAGVESLEVNGAGANVNDNGTNDVDSLPNKKDVAAGAGAGAEEPKEKAVDRAGAKGNPKSK